MYLLNKKNDEFVVENFNGEKTIIGGYQGGYEYRKIINGKVTDNLNNGVSVLKPIAFLRFGKSIALAN